MNKVQDIRTLDLLALTAMVKEMGEPSFRAQQIYQWLWQKGAHDFQSMTNLSKPMRGRLEQEFTISPLTIDIKQQSSDGTIKVRFVTHDGHHIEGVLIPKSERVTACVSSQIGCSLNCAFCATGYLPRKRNLERGEIFDQVWMLNQLALENYERPISNVVFMGMGEPLLNYRNVLEGIDRITAEDGLNWSPKRITVSTAGIAKMIKTLGDDGVKFNLALSLHATTDEKRNKIMPINEQNNLSALIEAMNYFYSKTKGRMTFEYILLDGVNESIEDAKRLVDLCRKVPAKVNVIEYNPIAEANFNKSQDTQREAFLSYLEHHGVTATMRRSRGKDIDAACGQLANK